MANGRGSASRMGKFCLREHGKIYSQDRSNSLFRHPYTRIDFLTEELGWCGREDSNFHGLSATATSTLRVYQFRHDRTS